MKSTTAGNKRKAGGLQINERRVTRSTTSGKSSSNSRSSMIEIDGEPIRPIGNDGSNSECVMCGKGGRLLCCESCPKTYHLKCLGLWTIPDGHWQCPSCCDDFSQPLNYLLMDYSVSHRESKPSPKLKYSSASSASKRLGDEE